MRMQTDSLGIEKIDFALLTNMHKQQASEEMSVYALMFTIVLGLLALVGTNNLKTHVRYAIAVAFIVIDTPIILSQYYSQKLHDALHQEIYDYVTEHPYMFTKKTVN